MNNLDDIIWQSYVKNDDFGKCSTMYDDYAKELFFKYKDSVDSLYKEHYRKSITTIRKEKLKKINESNRKI